MARMNCDSHHHHDLRLSFDGEKTFECSGCREKGLGARCACAKCGYVLHKECAKAKETVRLTHAFFPGCTFYFLNKSDLNHRCDACGGGIHGYFYRCFDRNLNLHPCCANLEYKKVIESTKGDGSMLLTLRDRERSKCFFCGKKRLNKNARSWMYSSDCGRHHFHVACLKEAAIAAVEECRALEIEKLANTLSVAGRRSRKASKFAKIAKIMKIAFDFVMAAVFGDPITLLMSVATAFANN